MVSLGHKTGLMNIQHMILYDFAKIGRIQYQVTVSKYDKFREKTKHLCYLMQHILGNSQI